jgi:nitrogen fixation protein NifU and related proteins
MSEITKLYQQTILDHNKNPRNFRKPERANRKAEGYNPVCGDQLVVYVEIENDMIKDIGFQGSGCAISKASASLMTESLKGKTEVEAELIYKKIINILTGELPAAELGDVVALSGVREFPVRMKCATLAWETLLNALKGKKETATTE